MSDEAHYDELSLRPYQSLVTSGGWKNYTNINDGEQPQVHTAPVS